MNKDITMNDDLTIVKERLWLSEFSKFNKHISTISVAIFTPAFKFL